MNFLSAISFSFSLHVDKTYILMPESEAATYHDTCVPFCGPSRSMARYADRNLRSSNDMPGCISRRCIQKIRIILRNILLSIPECVISHLELGIDNVRKKDIKSPSILSEIKTYSSHRSLLISKCLELSFDRAF
jgi:hypothetical protein